jgi:site-specific recombinase XerD
VTVDSAVWSAYRTWALTDGRLSPRTVDKSCRYLRFLEGLGIQLDQLDRPRILTALAAARENGRAPYTLNLWVTQLNRWVRFRGHAWKIPTYRHHHVADVPAPTRAQVEKIWRLSWADPATTARNRALFAVLLDKGLRRQEVVDLNLQDLTRTRKGPSLIVRHGKGEKERTVPQTVETAELIQAYVDRYRAPSDQLALFTTPRGRITHAYLGKIVKTAGERAGLPWLSCHKMRHFAVDDLLDRGVSVTSVAHVVGHEKVETTMLYRTKSLNRQFAEDEVRAVDRARFRSSRTPRGPPKAGPDGRAVEMPDVELPDTPPTDERAGVKSRRSSVLEEWTGRNLILWPGPLPECEPSLNPIEV